jgi:tetratricopeptide (TPR) repeat protein
MLAACVPEKPQAVIPITTSSPEALELFTEGRDLADRLRIAEARERFERAASRDPDFALAFLALAEVAPTGPQRHAALDRAVALAERVSEGERRMILGFAAGLRGNVKEQLESYTRMVQAYPDDERGRTLLGASRLDQGDLQRAEEELGEVTTRHPEYAPAWNLLGYARLQLGRREEAANAFERYIALLPGEPNPYDSYGELLMKMGRFAESMEQYEKALALDPSFVSSYVGLGHDLILLGRTDEARAAFRRMHDAARDDRQRREALLWTALSFVDEGAPDRALEILGDRQTLAERAGDVAAVAADHELMGLILLEAGRLDEAEARFAAAAAAVAGASLPEPVRQAASRRALYHEARLALARGEPTRARELASKLRQASVGVDDTEEVDRGKELAGLIALAEGDRVGAVRRLRARDGAGPRSLLLEARALEAFGSTDRARTAYARVARFHGIDPDYLLVRQVAKKKLDELPASDRREGGVAPDRDAAGGRRSAPR